MNLAIRQHLDIDEILLSYRELPSQPQPLKNLFRETAILWIAFGKGFAAIQPIMGKLIDHVQRNQTWREWGYSTFNDFMTRGMEEEFKVPRSQAYACHRLVASWPSITIPEAVEIGSTKLRELSRVTKEGEKNAGKWKAKAKELPLAQFKDEVSAAMGTTAADSKIVRIELVVTDECRKHWEEFIQKNAIPAIGTENMSDLLEAIIAECLSTWQ